LGKKKAKNKTNFTIDEAQTATLMYTEGSPACSTTHRNGRHYSYPRLEIRMCVKEALEPASRTFGTKIGLAKEKKVVCPPDLTPEGKGVWQVAVSGKRLKRNLERLSPLIPKYYTDKWKKVWKEGGCSLD